LHHSNQIHKFKKKSVTTEKLNHNTVNKIWISLQRIVQFNASDRLVLKREYIENQKKKQNKSRQCGGTCLLPLTCLSIGQMSGKKIKLYDMYQTHSIYIYNIYIHIYIYIYSFSQTHSHWNSSSNCVSLRQFFYRVICMHCSSELWWL